MPEVWSERPDEGRFDLARLKAEFGGEYEEWRLNAVGVTPPSAEATEGQLAFVYDEDENELRLPTDETATVFQRVAIGEVTFIDCVTYRLRETVTEYPAVRTPSDAARLAQRLADQLSVTYGIPVQKLHIYRILVVKVDGATKKARKEVEWEATDEPTKE